MPDVVKRGEVDVLGRLPWSSNATFLARATLDDHEQLVVYKPARGERPLWDFPDGVYRREEAAYLLSEALGWALVPPTVVREGPLGIGSVQQFIEADHAQHYFTLLEAGDDGILEQLRTVCCFDLLANSTDRKSGHCLIDTDRHVWAIDNSLAFHAEFKLRTVIWDFAGEPIDEALLHDVARLLDGGVPPPLRDFLDPLERDAFCTRARALLDLAEYPTDPTGRRFPWPLV